MQLPQYFQTDNTALAVSLSLGGCKAPKDERGNPMPQKMLYTKDSLRDLGYKGMPVDEALRAAIRDRKPGIRIFQFECSELRDSIEKGFNEAHCKMELNQDIHFEDLQPKQLGAFGYSYNRMRRKMLSNFKIPAICSDMEATTEKTETGAKASGTITSVTV